MRLLPIAVIFLLAGFNYGFSQSTIDNIKLHGIEKASMNYRIATLTQEQFLQCTKNLNPEKSKSNSIIHIDSLKSKFKTLTATDSCILINNSATESLKLCNKRGSTKKGSEMYRLINYNCAYVIALNGGYEWWQYLIIEPGSGRYFNTLDAPIFIDCSYAYSYGNYYGEGQFALIDLLNNKTIYFDSFNWTLETCIRSENSFYFEFISQRNRETCNYLSLQFE